MRAGFKFKIINFLLIIDLHSKQMHQSKKTHNQYVMGLYLQNLNRINNQVK
jgi:hypothetical protein